MAQAQQTIKDYVSQNEIVIFTKSYCPYCHRATALLNELGAKYQEIVFDKRDDGSELQKALNSLYKVSTVPQTFAHGERLGGCDDIHAMHSRGELTKKLGLAN